MISLKYKAGTGICSGVDKRKYTLTHSDETGELFLTIGKSYDYENIKYKLRDEVLGSWEKENDYYLLINLELDIDSDINRTIKRNKMFRKYLKLALNSIIYGDRLFFECNKELYEADIVVNFNSKFKEYNVVENVGKVKEYKCFDWYGENNKEKFDIQ